jgi:DNA-binding NarL/FixJ family response regulator
MAIIFNHSVISPVLVGRLPELQALCQFIDHAKGGRGQAVLIAGEAGIGKSRVLAEAQTYAASQGFLPFRISCFQTDTALPYAPLFEPLRNYLLLELQSTHSQKLLSIAEELSRLLPELAPFPFPPSPTRSEPLHLEPEQKKYRLRMTLGEFFIQLGTEQPLLILVEDVHWGDESTLEFLHYLMRRSIAQPIILLLTYRNDEVRAELKHWLAQLDHEHLSHHLILARLSRQEVDVMLRAIFGLNRAPHPHLLEILYTLTDGNPFFIEELLKSLSASGGIDLEKGSWNGKLPNELEIPRTVQAVVQQRSEQLSKDARRMIQLAAVMGRQFDFTVLQQLTQHSDLELLALMKELIAAQLIIEESAERFIFRHALTRQALYSSLLARERRLLHAAIAEMLELTYELNLERYAADLAYHFYEAASWEQALYYSMQAGKRAQSFYALRPALEHFTRGVEAAQHLDHAPPIALYRARGLTYEMLGEFKLALSDLEIVLRQANAAQEQQTEWQALIDLGLLWSGQNYDQAGDFYQRALELARTMDLPVALANSLNRIGNWHLNIEHPLEAYRYHQEALSIFQQLDDQQGIADTLDFLGMANNLGGNLVQGTRYYEQAVELFYILDQRSGLISSLYTLTMRGPTYQTDTMISAANTLTDAARDGESSLKLAREIGHRSDEAIAMIMLGICLGSQGAYQRAFGLLENTLALTQEIDHRQWITAAQVALGALYAEVLAFPEAVQQLKQAVEGAKAIQSLHWLRNAVGFLALAYTQQGELDQADLLLQMNLDLEQPIQTLGQRLLWRARAEIALARGEGALALQAVDRLLESATNRDHNSVIPRLAKARGDALLLLGQSDAAEIEFLQALEVARRQEALPLLWRIHASLAQLYQAQSRLNEARQQSDSARMLLEELARQLPESLRKDFSHRALCCLPQTSPSPAQSTLESASTKSNLYELTSREREVAILLALGRSNRQLAEELVVSERTAETHVRNILSKLNFTSRSQVALWAVATGLISPQNRTD